MKIRFQADADFNENIVRAVRRHQRAVDFQTASEAGLHGLEDPEVLTAAAREGRILVTHDRRTMPHQFADFVAHKQVSKATRCTISDTPMRASF